MHLPAQQIVSFIRKCPVCGNGSGYHFGEVNFQVYDDSSFPGNYMLAICTDCGHIFYDQKLTSDQVVSYYLDKIYDPSHVTSGSGSFNKDDIGHQEEIIKRLHDWFEETKDGITLDVGAGLGGLTKLLTDSGYKNVVAIEPSEINVEFIREKNLTAYVGSAQNLPKLSSAPTLVIYSHLFEHLLNPHEALLNIKKIIAPNGLIYVEVPDASAYPREGLPYNSLYLEHINHFTESSLKYLLELSGFDILRIEKASLNLFFKNGLYESVIYAIAKSQSSKKTLSPENRSSKVVPNLDKTSFENDIEGFLSYLDWSKNHPSMKLLDRLSHSSKPIWLWGVSQLTQLLVGQKPLRDANIAGFIDRDKAKQRHTILGKPIESPERLKTLTANDSVLLMVLGAEKQMKSYLSEIGFQGEVYTLAS
jgi:SAM-dependent methyltransferase